jgi:hypothetical protein
MKQTLSLVLLFIPFSVYATGNDHESDCDHPRFQEVGCAYPGEQGPPGQDGRDGVDGKDGRDGVDGKDGRDGVDGKDGEVPTQWITNVNKLYDQSRDYLAAATALQVHLPQDQKYRLTANMSRVGNATGVGAGFAYVLDDERNTAFTFAVARAGSETAVHGSVGFEFGGTYKVAAVPQPAPQPVADTSALEARISELEAIVASIPEPEPDLDLIARVTDLEGKRADDARHAKQARDQSLATQRKQEAWEVEQRAYAQQALTDLKEYQK